MDLKDIAKQFDISPEIADIKALGNGLINDTYLVSTVGDADDYVLQRINTKVFSDVNLMMHNIGAVTKHIRKKLMQSNHTDLKHSVLQFIPSHNDPNKLYIEEDGQYWRMMVYIDHAVTKHEVTPENAYAAGVAFGEFQSRLSDLPETLHESIPNFHNMEFRWQQLQEAISKNAVNRCNETEVQQLIAELSCRIESMTLAERLFRAGKLPKHICHCDTKVNNMLFSEDGQEVLCVIDLDTVMPSFIFSDYGDFLRTAANTVAEDEPDFSKIAFRTDIYQAFTRGYLDSADFFLTPMEKEMLPFAVKLFPYMQSVRFLWDYLNSDHYWKCDYPTHNLIRAQNQFHYLLNIEKIIDN